MAEGAECSPTAQTYYVVVRWETYSPEWEVIHERHVLAERNLRESIEKQRIEQTYMYINTGIHSENVGIKKNEILCRKMNGT